MKILLTGSHFTPAQAVIEELKKIPHIEIVYIGRKTTLEGDKTQSRESLVLPDAGVKFLPLIAGRIRRNFDIYTLTSLFKIPIGFFQSFFYLFNEKPDVIVSFGGYVGLPVVFSGWLLSKPILLHEQTLISGMSNFISSFFADKIAVSFEKDYSFPKNKVVVTGNPIRKELQNGGTPSKEIKNFINESKKIKKPLIFITGGNQGSHFINEKCSPILNKLTENFYVIHQSGDSKFHDFENLGKLREGFKYPSRYLVEKWFDPEDIFEILKNSEFVISRAGANSLGEFCFFGVPALVIPIPYLHNREQEKNARYFHEKGICEILPQKEITPAKLFEKIMQMHEKNIYYSGKAVLAKKNCTLQIDAAKKIAQEIQILLKKN